MDNYFIDTETVGFHGPVILLQYAINDGPIDLWSVWEEPVYATMELIEELCMNNVIGFNLSFDWFHICQLYTTLSLLDKDREPDIIEYAYAEPEARKGLCLKPASCFDIMLHARKGEYQSTMNRGDIRIKKVPTALAWLIVDELNQRIPLKDVYFARRKDKTIRWQVFDITNDLGDINPEFKDIVLKFSPSSALKALAGDALGVDTEKIKLFADVDLPPKARPIEIGYAPFALAPYKNKYGRIVYPSKDNWRGKWPEVIRMHISHWTFNSLAREYAEDDVKYTRDLYKYFGSPDSNDDDSILACMVGAVRWKGFRIDKEAIQKLKEDLESFLRSIPFNYNAPVVCRRYLEQVMDETEKLAIRESTKAIILEEIATWTLDEVCDECGGMGCQECNEGTVPTDKKHPAAERAKLILDARHAKKEIENYEKLLFADRFHASFNVIGTLSSRMSGADGLNAQGIKRAKDVRQCFPLSDPSHILCGGDFAGFEVCLADAVYSDPMLREDLLSGKKIHGLFGQYLFPHMSYEEIVATKDTAKNPEDDLYSRSKNGVFALIYMGEAYTLSNRVGVPEHVAEEAYQRFITRYKVFGEKRKKYADMFASMRQPGGIGTAVEWHEPHDYIESMFGFRRYFSLENRICKELYKLAEKPPKQWQNIKVRLTRRDREQTASGAARSALFAAAFALQAANMRAAGNHVIQSSGAQMTKMLQRRLWDLQPIGINHWRVQPMNVHDEIMLPADPSQLDNITKIVEDFVEEYRAYVPLLEIDWANGIKSWADK